MIIQGSHIGFTGASICLMGPNSFNSYLKIVEYFSHSFKLLFWQSTKYEMIVTLYGCLLVGIWFSNMRYEDLL